MPPQPGSLQKDRNGVLASLSTGRGGRAEVIEGTGRFVGQARGSGQGNTEPKTPEDGVTLNLVNLPIPQAAKIVLGDIMGVNYIVDPKLGGLVTVYTPRPMTKAAAVELFQQALRTSGAALVQSGGAYKIVPVEQASTAGGDIVVNERGVNETRVGGGAEVVQLRYVSPAEMKNLLDPISPHGGVVSADNARHTLTLSGSPQDIAILKEAIAAFDIDTMRGMSFALVPVTSSDPDAMAADLRSVFGAEKEGPMSGMIRFIGNKRLSAILAISPQPRYLERARAWIRRLDARAQGNEKQFYSYRVQNRPAKELQKVLTSMFGGAAGGAGSNVAPRFGQASMSSDASSSAASPIGTLNSAAGPSSSVGIGAGVLGSGGLGAPTGGAPAGLGGASGGNGGLSSSGAFGVGAQAAKSAETNALGDESRFKISVDDAKNALVIMATPDDYKRLLRVVQALDVQPDQVFIEATIAEVTLNDQLNFGVRWFFQSGKSAIGLSDLAGVTPAPNNGSTGSNVLGAAVGSAFPGFSYALQTSNAMATINALNTITKVNILSTPSLTVLDNRQATLQVGDQVPITTFSASTINSNGAYFNGTQYLATGVILSITPHISENGTVMLELEQEVSNVSADTPANATNPTIQQRQVKTQVMVGDGESLMLGGLIQDQRTKAATQMPILGDIPVVGNAFKQKSDQIQKSELLIMITPHIIHSSNDAREVTEEYRRKMFQLARDSKTGPHTIGQSARRMFLDQ